MSGEPDEDGWLWDGRDENGDAVYPCYSILLKLSPEKREAVVEHWNRWVAGKEAEKKRAWRDRRRQAEGEDAGS